LYKYAECYHAVENGKSLEYNSRVLGWLAAVPIFNLYFPLDLGTEKFPTMSSLFTPLLTAINSRTTTKFEDETGCMATLLRLDTGKLQAISKKRYDRDKMTEEEKAAENAVMHVWSYSCAWSGPLNRDIFNKRPRLQNDGFRWAPRSFLGQSKATMVDTANTRWDRTSKSPDATILNESCPGVEEGHSEAISETPIKGMAGLLLPIPELSCKPSRQLNFRQARSICPGKPTARSCIVSY
jgi:hypothetical protein